MNKKTNEQHTAMKEIAEEQYAEFRLYLPVRRGNMRLPNAAFINELLRVAEHGRKRRALTNRCGNWLTVDTPMRRWAMAGALYRLFASRPGSHNSGTSPSAQPQARFGSISIQENNAPGRIHAA